MKRELDALDAKQNAIGNKAGQNHWSPAARADYQNGVKELDKQRAAINQKYNANDQRYIKENYPDYYARNYGGKSNPQSLPSPASSPAQPPVSSSPSTKPYSPITSLPTPPTSPNASGGNKQNWGIGGLRVNDSPEFNTYSPRINSELSAQGKMRQQELAYLRNNYKEMKSKGLEAKYWDKYQKINEKYDLMAKEYLQKNPPPPLFVPNQSNPRNIPNSSSQKPVYPDSPSSSSKIMNDLINKYSQVPAPSANTRLPLMPDMLQSANQNGSSKLKNSGNLTQKSSSALLPDKTATSSNNLPTAPVRAWQEEMFRRGYGEEMEWLRAFFYDPRYNALVGTWGTIATKIPFAAPITVPFAAVSSMTNNIGKYWFANSLDEQLMANLGGLATIVAPEAGGLMGSPELLTIGAASKGGFLGGDYAKWMLGVEPEGFRQDLWELQIKSARYSQK